MSVCVRLKDSRAKACVLQIKLLTGELNLHDALKKACVHQKCVTRTCALFLIANIPTLQRLTHTFNPRNKL